MKQIKKILSLILLICISASLAAGLSGCGIIEESKTFLVYYTNEEEDDIVYKEYVIEDYENLDAEKLTNNLLNKMFESESAGEGLHSAKPSSVGLNGFEISDNLITFDFDRNYKKLTNVQEIMLRAAVVLTIIAAGDYPGYVYSRW